MLDQTDEIARLVAALRWYADEDNYNVSPAASVSRYDRWPVVTDRGARARAALAGGPSATDDASAEEER